MRGGGGLLTLEDLYLFLRAGLIALHVPLELLIFVGQNELVRQVILVEVVNKIPKSLLVLLLAT